ncbi:MAG: hypothetical protein OCC45_15525 [Desulfotalea sp.]
MLTSKSRKDLLRSLGLISIVWIGPSIFLYLLNYTDAERLFSSQTMHYIVIGLFILLLSTIMAIFFKIEISHLHKNNKLRRNLIIILIIARLLLFQVEGIDSFIGILAGIAGSTTLVIFSCLLGSYLSQAINRLPEIIPVCSVAFTVDLYSVFKGPSKKIALQIGDFYSNGAIGPVPFIDIILLKIPNPPALYLIPMFGVSDLIFAVFLSSVLLKFQISDSIIGKDLKDIVHSQKMHFYFPLVSCALLISIVFASIFEMFIPALPVIIMIVLPWVIVRNFALFKLKRSDLVLTLIPLILASIVYFSVN